MAENEQVLFETLQNMPYSLEAEQSVLGALLLEPDQIGAVLEQLPRPEMFYRKQHRELFGVLCGMFSLNKTIDFVTVLDEAVRAAGYRNYGRQFGRRYFKTGFEADGILIRGAENGKTCNFNADAG